MSNAMTFEKTPTVKPNPRRINTKLTASLLEDIGSGALVWHLIKRHKHILLFNIFVAENLYLALHYFTVI